MTPRQREFCRHYLRGLSASRAAHAAGYASSVAEKNAATILSSHRVARYLERHRQAARLVSLEHLLQVRDAMLAVLKDPDPKDKTMAAHALVRLYNIQDKLAAQQAGQEPLQNTAKISSQPDDNQPTHPTENLPESLPETDTLDTGQPAHGIRLSPLKAQAAMPKTPVTVVFRGLTRRKPAGAAGKRPRAKPKT